jgi:threonine/homoserine/homoserine lactone efflux protein
MNEILTFSIVALLLVMSPGPNGVLIVKTASSFGRTASFANITGLFVATFCHGALSIFGLSALLLQSAELFMLIKIVGALYLFYVGVKAIYQSCKKRQPLTAIEASGDQVGNKQAKSALAKGIFNSFSEGFLTQLLNPKVSMFYLAAFPQFVSFEAASYSVAFALVAIHACLIATWFVGITLMIDKIKQRAQHSSMGKWVQRLSGSVMIYFSVLLLGQKA